MVYKTNPLPKNNALNALFSSAWGGCSRKDFSRVLAHGLAHICAYDVDMLVGFVNVAWDGEAHAFILDTSVHKDYQHQGIATALVKRAAEAARQADVEWLHVDYELHLTEFYAKCGFEPTEAGLIKLQK
ncbi:MAG: GNAT family N-acetyltransferase [Hyphomicrobiales bacterium]|nr:MAG: GNAT family N-acetyltransferase [Hyphomicrobiales bacterium]